MSSRNAGRSIIRRATSRNVCIAPAGVFKDVRRGERESRLPFEWQLDLPRQSLVHLGDRPEVPAVRPDIERGREVSIGIVKRASRYYTRGIVVLR